jgi:atypical dual specificity phosphatase
MSEIIDNLYLGDKYDAESMIPEKEKWNVKIITCAQELGYMDCDYFISLYDDENNNIMASLDEGADIIENNLKKGNRVLVHCMAGVSRSATVITYYLMKYKKMKFSEAYNHVKKIRPIVNIHQFFWRTLCKVKVDDPVLPVESEEDRDCDNST